MPFAGYENFNDCVAKNKDKSDPEAYCGKIKAEVEGTAKKGCPCESIQLLKSNDRECYIYGPASVEVKDKQNDRIRASALETSLAQLIRRGRLSYGHQDVIVGEILPEAIVGGKLYKTHVTHDRMMVLGKIWNDTEAGEEAIAKSKSGELKSYSISGQIRKGGAARVCDSSGCYRDIFKIDQHAVTLCEEGMNPGAHYEVLQKGDIITFATYNKDSITSSSEGEVHKNMAEPETKPIPPNQEVAKTDGVPPATGGGGGVEDAIKAMMGMMEKMMNMMGGGGESVQEAQKAAAVPEVKPEVAVTKADFDKLKAETEALKNQLAKATVATTPRPDATRIEKAPSQFDEIMNDPSKLDKMSFMDLEKLREE